MLSRRTQRSLQRYSHQARPSALKATRIVGLWQRRDQLRKYSVYYKRQLPNAVTPYASPRPTWPTQQPRLTRRSLSTEAIPSILLPPVVFIGLLLALWTWKCLMMVLFQDKIIYMPSMPPFARREKVAAYTDAQGVCNGVTWEAVKIKCADGVRLSILVGRAEGGAQKHDKEADNEVEDTGGRRDVFIAYFQGNGSSVPPRVPMLSSVLKSIHARTATLENNRAPTRYTLLALSYRGYWTSSGRATQSGIELDAEALLSYITTTALVKSNADKASAEIVLWGQSIGAGVATTAAARYIERHSQEVKQAADAPRITGIVMETPFTSIKNMLVALYPQKWLPYRYLHPFLWNRWDSEIALTRIAASPSAIKPRILLLPATRDEVVPPEDAGTLEDLCREVELDVTRVDVLGALHHEATGRKDGQDAIAKFIVSTV